MPFDQPPDCKTDVENERESEKAQGRGALNALKFRISHFENENPPSQKSEKGAK